MARTAIAFVAAMAVFGALWPLRPAAGAESMAPPAELIAADALVELAATLEPVTEGRAYTVRIAGFVDPDGTAGERLRQELEAAGLDVELERARRGEVITRARVGELSADDAERLAAALKNRYAWPLYVARR